MTIKIREFHWDKDFELIRKFLIESNQLASFLLNWTPQRFEYRKFGQCGDEYKDIEDELVSIWEEITDSKDSYETKIVAVTVLEPPSTVWIHIHPYYRYLEKRIIQQIESQRFDQKNDDLNELEINFLVLETDFARIEVLKELGYENLGLNEYNRQRKKNQPIPEYKLPSGYKIRQVDVEKDFIPYKAVLESVFSHCGQMTRKMAKIFSSASFYKADLDLVIIAPEGNFAAFCTFRMDPINKIVEIEPVGTHPNYRKRGLAKALILEGLKRVQKYNPSLICIQGAATTEAANRLYDSLGFIDKIEVNLWKKTL